MKFKILTPNYMEEFECVGTKCEDNCCCTNWNIMIDKKTLKKYKNEKDLKKVIVGKIIRNRSSKSNLTYAKIKMDSEGKCPFLTEDKLCKVQLGKGEEYLSITCSIYPRVYNVVDNIVEISANLSCPEVARLVLLNKNVMEFNEGEKDLKADKIYISKNIDTGSGDFKYFWQLRIFTISLLQNKNIRLWERLIILGMFYEKLQKYIIGNKIDDIPQLIENYYYLIQQGVFKDELEDVPANNTIQIELLKEVAYERIMFSKTGVGNRYLQCFSEFLKGISYNQECSKEELGEKYYTAYNEYYEQYMREHEYILENYLVNYVFEKLFPFNGYESCFDNYVILILHYAMIKMHLIGMSAYYKEKFNSDNIIKLIQSFAKEVEHGDTSIKYVYDLLKENNMLTMPYMSILIKN